VAADAVTATPTGLELPPQPERLKATIAVMANRQISTLDLRPEGLQLFRNIDPSQIVKQIAPQL
jgi:hypothetical protein